MQVDALKIRSHCPFPWPSPGCCWAFMAEISVQHCMGIRIKRSNFSLKSLCQ